MELAEFIFLSVGTYYDMKSRELPRGFFVVFGALAILLRLCLPYYSFVRGLIGGCVGVTFLIVGYLSKQAIGYGDGLGLIILGIFEGWKGMVTVVIVAFLLAAIYGSWGIFGLKKSYKEVLPFYPFLLAAYLVVLVL